jgi:O-antigen ligase
MTIVYVLGLLFAFTLTIAPATQYLLDPLFDAVGIGAGFRTPSVDAAMMLCAFVALAAGASRGSGARLGRAGYLWVPWLVWLAISSGFDGIGLWKFEMYVARVAIPCLTILTLYCADPRRFERCFLPTLVALTLVLLPVMFFFDFGEKSFESNIWLSRLLGIVIIYIVLRRRSGQRSTLDYPLIAALGLAMVLIGSRGPVLSLLVVWGLLHVMTVSRRPIATVASALLLGVAALALANSPGFQRGAAQFLSHGEASSLSEIQNDRSPVYAPTLALVAERPLSGVGLGQWSRVFYDRYGLYDDGSYKYPHNFLLEILSELGVPGLLFWLLLFVPLRSLLRDPRGYAWFVLLGLLYAGTSSDITQNALPVMMALLARAGVAGTSPAFATSPRPVRPRRRLEPNWLTR